MTTEAPTVLAPPVSDGEITLQNRLQMARVTREPTPLAPEGMNE